MLRLEDRVLAEREIFAVLADLTQRARRSTESRQNLVIFRLACCCGLRVGEIASLTLRDINVDQGPPKLEICKTRLRAGKVTMRSRVVPLSFDEQTEKDIVKWRWLRWKQSGGDRFAPLICGLRECNLGEPLTSRTLAKRWKTAVRCLGPERVRQLSISAGRHSGLVQLLRRGASLPAVQKFAGHASTKQTASYLELLPGLHSAPDRNVFAL